MFEEEYKTKMRDAAKTAFDVFDTDCDGIYDCDKSCPYFGDRDDETGFNCILVKTSIKLEKIIKISERK